MERAEILNQVAAELAHIPIWPGEHQGLFRAIYRLLRANALGARGPGGAAAVLDRSASIVRRDYPGAEFEYDRTFFRG
jgi:hypothetical protein